MILVGVLGAAAIWPLPGARVARACGPIAPMTYPLMPGDGIEQALDGGGRGGDEQGSRIDEWIGKATHACGCEDHRFLEVTSGQAQAGAVVESAQGLGLVNVLQQFHVQPAAHP
jgi:hypothetical protein